MHSPMLEDRLAEIRIRAGLSAKALDRLAGLGLGHTAIIERGDRPEVAIPTVQRLARALGSTVGWLANGEGKPPTDTQVAAAVKDARARLAAGASERGAA